MAQSFWVIPDVKGMRTPYSILLEQAKALTEASDGLLVGEVERTTATDYFRNTLNVVVPELNNYSFEVLYVTHGIQLFPARMFPSFGHQGGYELADASALEKDLEKLLASPQITNAIASLLAQVRGE